MEISDAKSIFSGLSDTYELANHILTFGLDTAWRRKAAEIASEAGGGRWIDLCSGTGEMASNLHQSKKRGTSVFAADFCMQMLRRVRAKPEGEYINLVLADTKTLPFPPDAFDLVTMSFATRNINLSRDALINTFGEIQRVLKPGGLFINLETSRSRSTVTRGLLRMYLKLFVGPIGGAVSGSKKAYSYLTESMRRFYSADELSTILELAGFDGVGYKKLSFGIIAIHHGTKEGDRSE